MDGAILQLGYYSLATGENPFLGSWMPISGEGSRNGDTVATIGSYGDLGPGQFDLDTGVLEGSPLFGNDIPSVGTPLSLRFYNGRSLAESTRFNAVSNPSWDWERPSNGFMTITLSDPGLVWQGGRESAFRTTLPVPEPGAGVLLGCGAVALARGKILRKRMEPPHPLRPRREVLF